MEDNNDSGNFTLYTNSERNIKDSRTHKTVPCAGNANDTMKPQQGTSIVFINMPFKLLFIFKNHHVFWNEFRGECNREQSLHFSWI